MHGSHPIVSAYISGQPGAGLRAKSFSRPGATSARTRRSEEESAPIRRVFHGCDPSHG